MDPGVRMCVCVWQKGSSDAITDVSTASGWMILDCDPNAMAQDIRMVCNSTDTASNGCAHMLTGGAEGKLVRLPDNVSDDTSWPIFELRSDGRHGIGWDLVVVHSAGRCLSR